MGSLTRSSWGYTSGVSNRYASPPAIICYMFRAIGIVILLYAITNAFSQATTAFEKALVATFGAVETAAEQSTVLLTTTP